MDIRLQRVTTGYNGLQRVTTGYNGLQRVTLGYAREKLGVVCNSYNITAQGPPDTLSLEEPAHGRFNVVNHIIMSRHLHQVFYKVPPATQIALAPRRNRTDSL